MCTLQVQGAKSLLAGVRGPLRGPGSSRGRCSQMLLLAGVRGPLRGPGSSRGRCSQMLSEPYLEAFFYQTGYKKKKKNIADLNLDGAPSWICHCASIFDDATLV